MVDIPTHMQKIVSLFMALMIFAFSFIEKDMHASFSSCHDSAVVQSTTNVDALKDNLVEAALTMSDSNVSADFGFSMHDCHFGHCSFIPLVSAKFSSPAPLVGIDVVRHLSFIHSGFRSETLRPPSLV